ncbi:putative thiamine biosynthesis protein [Oxobacter pfennigii]|uniref:Putative thiamine biosynthesis protein n=1 Tax=Oxobacter pfennigii TaxID=36849 RepID=A0A0P8WYI0_9CLOT|nr:ABC transporter substrate-binding protein [Oxobacter pfennigii]KPU43451.1 putative thiamine biosynthesis protein [Oxobacter pfennigii]
MKKYIIIAFIFCAAALSMLTGCSTNQNKDGGTGQDTKTPDKIIFTLDWAPNTNHTGIYAAKAKGFFEEEGLDVEIIQPGQNTADQLVASGNAQFGIGYQEGVTLARLEGLPIVSIAAVIQHNTSAFAAPKSKNINTPKDFEGKKYAGWGSPIEEATLKALMDKYNADINEVTILTTGATDFFATTEKDADFAWIYYGWDGIASKIKNKPISYIMLKDEDKALDYYTPVITAGEKTISENPDLVKRFLRAAAKGYDYAAQNPEGAANILLSNAPELDSALVIESQKWLSPKYKDDAPVWGLQKKEVWEEYTKWLYDRKLIDEMLDVDKAFTNDFLPEK